MRPGPPRFGRIRWPRCRSARPYHRRFILEDSLYADLDISPVDFEARRRRGEVLQLVDVREAWEWDYNRIPGARHLPLDELELRFRELLESPDPIVFYCHHGIRSQHAAAWLRQQGCHDCRSLEGGIDAWANATYSDMPRY